MRTLTVCVFLVALGLPNYTSSNEEVKSKTVQKFIEEPKDTEVNPGENVRLRCVVLNRSGDCAWLKDGVAVGRIPDKYVFKRSPKDGDCSVQILDTTLEEDDGSWQCQVTQTSIDEKTLASTNIKLVVLESPHPPSLQDGTRLLTPGSNFTTKAGESSNFQCVSGKGNPPAFLRWFLDSQDVSQLATQTNIADEEKPHTWKALSVLNYTFNKTDNGKQLRCGAYHVTYGKVVEDPEAQGLGHRDVAVTLDVKYPPEIKYDRNPPEEVEEGDTLTLSCVVTKANPPVDSVTWRKTGQSGIYARGRILEFPSILRADSGVYSCFAKNDVGESQIPVAVDVKFPPKIIRVEPPMTTFNINEVINLQCEAEGNPAPEITWLRQNEKDPEKWEIQGQNRTLTIENASYSNSGVYRCDARNMIRSEQRTAKSREIRLVIQGKPTLRTNIRWTRNSDGSRSAELVCTVDSVNPSRTKWLGNDGSPLLQGESIELSVVGNDHSAKINNASELNYGNYTCVSQNKYGIAMSTVEISGKPTLETTMQWTRDVDGSRMVELVCEVHSANARRTDWLRSDGSPLVHGEFVHLFVDGNKHTAKLKNVSELDYGNYTCLSQNKYGIGISTVEVSGKPTLRTSVHWTRNLDGSRGAELVCTVDSANPSRTKWLGNDGSPLRPDEYIQLSVDKNNNRAKFSSASELNYGNYTCVSQNKYGIAMSTVEMSGKPILRTKIEWTRDSDGSRSAQLVCTVDSANPSRTKWLGNDMSPLLQGESIELSVVGNDHRAKINNASELNYGNYTCVSQNKYGIAMSTVEISGKPTLKTTIQWTRGVDGSRMVELVCEVHSANARRTDWLRSDGSPLVHGEVVHLFVDGNKHMAKLKNVSELDYGNYTCLSQNKYGIAISTIEVSGKPTLRTSVHWTRNLDGSRGAELVCTVDSANPSSTKWLGNDGSLLRPDEYIQLSVDKNNNRAKFSNASELNYGNYTCVSQNKYGIAMSTVEMSGKPILRTKIEWTRDSDGSRSAQLVCTVDSANPSRTKWLGNDGSPLLQGESIELSVVGNDHRAKINNASELNYGNYTCVSQNKYGIAMSTVEISGKATLKTTIQWTRGVDGSRMVELVCEVHSANARRTDWLRSDGSPLVHGEFVHLFVDGNKHTAKLKNVSELDYGNYTCLSQNKYGIAISTIEVSGKPTLRTSVHWTRNLDGSRGAELVCTVDSANPSRTKWLGNDGSLLRPDEYIQLSVDKNNNRAKFSNASELNYGNYTCVSQNKYGIAMSTVEMSGKPILRTKIEWTRDSDGSRSAQLVCTVDSANPSRTKWLGNDGSPLLQGESIELSVVGNDHRAKINNASELNYGNYTCVSQNKYGIAMSTVEISGKPTLKTTIQWTRGVDGSRMVELVCEVHSANARRTDWLRSDGSPLVHGEFVHLFVDGNKHTAKLKNVSELDYGNYTCLSQNKYGISISTVEVSGKPTLRTSVHWTRNLDGSRGAELVCTVDSANPSRTKWLGNDGSPLRPDEYIQLSVDKNNNRAKFSNASELNYGNYTCVSQNKYGIAMSTVEMSGKPTLRTNLEWTRNSDGSRSAELVCMVDSANPSRTKWLDSDGSPLLQGESIELSVVGNDHRAKINNASELNYGNYTCVSQNKYGIAMSTVEISGKPTLKTTIQWTRGVDGSRMVELVCEVHSANSRRTDWIRSDGSPLVHGEFVHLYVDGNKHTAKLNNVSELDYGNYTCLSQNKYGIAISTVEVSGKPTLRTSIQWTRNLDGSRGAELVCTVDSANPSRTKWLGNDGSPLRPDEYLKLTVDKNNHRVKFNIAKKRNYGNYTCVSQNKYGIAMSTVEMSGKPTLRTNIEWTRNSDGSRSAELVCMVDSANPSRTKWLGSDGSPLLQGESIELSVVGSDHRAKINNASELNYGNYTCVSQNKYGIAMSTVEISGKPTLKTTMQWTRGVDGSRMVELVCEVHSANSRRTDWLRSDGSPLVHGEFVHLYVDGNKHTAKLNNVSELDYGNYTCLSQNKYGIAISTVEVSGKPTLRTSIQWKRNLDGSRGAELVCTVDSANPSRTKWLGNDGSPLRPDEYLKLSVDKNNHRVKFNIAKKRNYGNYTCVSQNKYGIAMSTVEMSGKPTLRTNLEWTRNSDGSRSAELVCMVDSANPSRTMWLGSDGSPLLQGESIELSVVESDHRAKINNASELNYGNYTCVSQNKYGIAMSTVEISGKPTLKTTIQWTRGVDGSRMVELVCEVFSANARRTDWLRSDGSPLVHGEFVHLFVDGNKHTAKLNNVSELDYGNYTCLSQNKYGIAISTVEVSGKPTLRTSVHWTRNLDGSRGAELVCTVDSANPSRTKWLGNDGSPLRPDEYIQLSVDKNNNRAKFSNASELNYGNYTCVSQNKYGIAMSTVEISGKPTLRTNIEWTRNSDGSRSAELVCTVDSANPSRTKWLGNDGSPLLQGDSIQLSVVGSDHRAKINNASELNYGNYTCVSQNKYGIAMSTVEISGKPTLKTTIQWTRRVDGSRMVELVCEVFSANARRTDWLRSDGSPLVHGAFVHLFADGNKHTAKLYDVSELDYGNYTCVSQNKYGIGISTVEVSGKPTLRTSIHWTRNLDGSRGAELVCTVDSANPSRTKWLRNDGSPLRPDEYLQLYVDENNHRVKFNNASELNYGNYTCVSQNKYGIAMSTVEMSGKPSLRTNIKWTRNSDGSRSAELFCTVDSANPSRTKWLGNDGSPLLQGESIDLSVVGSDHRAKINNASELNYGNYTCVSQNKYGIAMSTVEISGKPTLKTAMQWSRGVDGSRMIELVCEVFSANARRTDWLRSDGSPLVHGEYVHLLVDGNKLTAKLNNVSELDYDNYTCVSQNKYGIAMSTVEISGKPTLRTTIHWTRNLDGSRGAELVCTVDSANPSRTKWLANDGSPLRPDEHVQLSVDKNKHRVKFNHPSELNYGNYTCVSQNKYGIAMSTVEMSGKPTLRTNIEWKRTSDGSRSAELVCTVDSANPSRTKWLGNDGSPLLQGESIQLSVVGNDHRAKINNASELNYGNYTCLSQNKYGIAMSTVEVSGKPSVETILRWTRGLDGSPIAELLCTVHSARPSRTVWLRSDASPVVHGESLQLAVADDNYTVKFHDVKEKDYGNYTCISQNKYGIAMSTVEISGKPTVTTTLQWTRKCDGNLSAELVCVVFCPGLSCTHWQRDDGTPLFHSESVHLSSVGYNTTAKFNNVSERNYGNYTCVSKNKYGIAMGTVEISDESAKTQDLHPTFLASTEDCEMTNALSLLPGDYHTTKAKTEKASRNSSTARTS